MMSKSAFCVYLVRLGGANQRFVAVLIYLLLLFLVT